MGKGVSAAEKRQRMVDMFQADCSVYTMKEIQKHAPKTGIVSGAVEGVLKDLVGDDLVHEAKLGGSWFFWSFPGEKATKKRAELSALSADIQRLQQQVCVCVCVHNCLRHHTDRPPRSLLLLDDAHAHIPTRTGGDPKGAGRRDAQGDGSERE